MQIHIGSLIRDEMRQQGHTNEWLAERIGTSPRNLQRIYNKSSIDSQLLFNISLTLHTDFFKFFSTAFSDMTNSVT